MRSHRFVIDHRFARRHLSPYLDGELGSIECQRVERHVAESRDCRLTTRSLRGMLAGLAGLRRYALSRLSADVRARLGGRSAGRAGSGRTGSPALRPWRLAVLVACLSVAVAGCGGAEGTGSSTPEGLRVSTSEWKTDFARHSVPLSEFTSGGPGRDGIPPIDEPSFVSQDSADEWLADREPVLVVELDGVARAYPVQILTWHEIVNDDLAGRPIAVTFCPLCNSSVVFDRRIDGRELTFGTTGNLRKSDLVMWDRQTESWWQQFSGEAIVGQLTGERLTPLASQTLSWKDYRKSFPSGDVLSRGTGFSRDYGRNPYRGYDAPGEEPFLFQGETDKRLPPKERVTAVFVGDEAAVVPFSRLRRDGVTEFEVAGTPVVVMFKPGVVSALDEAEIADSEDVGTSAAFDRRLDGRSLSFERRGEAVVDRETASTWDITGRATDGPLRGKQLKGLRHDQQFWFALAAFLPEARIVD